MQYQIGTASIVTGNGTVNFSVDADLTDVNPATDWFYVVGGADRYKIASKTFISGSPGYWRLTLIGVIVETTNAAALYTIHNFFTPNKGLPLPDPGDVQTAQLISRAFQILDLDAGPGGGGTGWSATWYDVRAYGGVLDGSTDDTAAFAAAYAAVPSTGGAIYIGRGKLKVTSGFTISKPITIIGEGGTVTMWTGNPAYPVSSIIFTSGTGTLFTVNAPFQIKDVMLRCTHASPTAGAGIFVNSSLFDSFRIVDTTIYGFYDCVKVQQAYGWFIRDSYIAAPVRYGLLIANTVVDGGNQSISGTSFLAYDRNATAAVRFESGGGFKMVNCKVTGAGIGAAAFANGISVQLIASGNTGDFLVCNTSIEDVSSYPIRLIGNSNSIMTKLMFTAVQCNAPASTHSVYVTTDTTGQFQYMQFVGCNFLAASGPVAAINLNAGASNLIYKVVLAGNIWIGGHTTLLTTTNISSFNISNLDEASAPFPNGSTGVPTMKFAAGSGFWASPSGNYVTQATVGAKNCLTFGPGALILPANSVMQFTDTNDDSWNGTPILGICRDGGGYLEVNGGTVGSGGHLKVNGTVRPKSYTVSTVPSAASFTGGMIYVSNETGGAVTAFSDGSAWRRHTDRAVVA